MHFEGLFYIAWFDDHLVAREAAVGRNVIEGDAVCIVPVCAELLATVLVCEHPRKCPSTLEVGWNKFATLTNLP